MRKPIEREVQADWERVRWLFDKYLTRPAYSLSHEPTDNADEITVFRGDLNIATITVARGKNIQIRVVPLTEDDTNWAAVLTNIEEEVTPAELTPKAIIEKFYRRKARNSKLTLRQHLHDLGLEAREGYIRNAKIAYDRQRKRAKKV